MAALGALGVAAAALHVSGAPWRSVLQRAEPGPRLRGVVLVVLDAARARSFGAYGGGSEVSPAVDDLARESVFFEHAFTPAPYTRAAMTAVWTSRQPGERGMRRAPRLPEVLFANGVATAAFVANPNAGRNLGLDRGFALFDERDADPPPRSDELVPAFEAFVRAQAGRFFAYVHVREPHFPYDPPRAFAAAFGPARHVPEEAFTDPDWIDSLNRRGAPTEGEAEDLRRRYEANLAFADSVVARLRGVLESAGAWKDTAFVVTADHGEAFGEHGFVGHNRQVYAESAEVPLVLRLPGRPAARRSELASLLDLAPTIAGLFDAHDADWSFEGRDLLKPLPADRRLLCVADGTSPDVALRSERETLVVAGHDVHRYDSAGAPGEQHDLAPARPAIVSRLREQLERAKAHVDLGVPRAPLAPSTETKEMLRTLGYSQ